jgi:toxin ParE1/3/4
MATRPVLFSRLARHDLMNIWIWVATTSGEARASLVLSAIERGISRLEDYPHFGPAKPEIAANACMLVVQRWLVLYAASDADIRIVRIVDGALDQDTIEWTTDFQ